MLHALFIGTIIDTAKRYNSFCAKDYSCHLHGSP